MDQQLRSEKKFVDELAAEREGEREEFTNKIEQLEEILKRKEKEEDSKISLGCVKVSESTMILLTGYHMNYGLDHSHTFHFSTIFTSLQLFHKNTWQINTDVIGVPQTAFPRTCDSCP